MNELTKILPPFGPRITFPRTCTPTNHDDLFTDLESGYAADQNRLAEAGQLRKGFDIIDAFLPGRPPEFAALGSGGFHSTLEHAKALLGRWCPPGPLEWDIVLVKVPAAPLLPAEPDCDQDCFLLARAVRAVQQSKMMKPSCFGLGRRPRSARVTKSLQGGAEFLRQHGIAPLAWVSFAYAAWARKSAKPPRPNWIFGPWARKPNTLEWYGDWRQGNFIGAGTCLMGPLHRELIERHHLFLNDLSYSAPTSTTQAGVILDAHFPGHSFDAALKSVKAEAHQIAHTLARKLDDGVLLWR